MRDTDNTPSPNTRQDLTLLEPMLNPLRVTASSQLRARVLAIPQMSNETNIIDFVRPYIASASMAMAACLLIGLFTQPLIGSVFDLNMLNSTDISDLLFPAFDPWKI
ncbi:MAG: hypothetical protein ACON41_04145 [Parvibaculales bacterium]